MPTFTQGMVKFLQGRVSLREIARETGVPWSTFQRRVARGQAFTGERYTNISGMYRSFVRGEARAVGYPQRLVAKLATLRPETVELRLWEHDSIVQNLATSRAEARYQRAKDEGKPIDWNDTYDEIVGSIRKAISRSKLPWDDIKERYGKG